MLPGVSHLWPTRFGIVLLGLKYQKPISKFKTRSYFIRLHKDSCIQIFNFGPGRESMEAYRPGSSYCRGLGVILYIFVSGGGGGGFYFQRRGQSWLVPEASLVVLFI